MGSDIKILVKDLELIENQESIREYSGNNFSNDDSTEEGYIIVNKKIFNNCHNASQFLGNPQPQSHNDIIEVKHRNKTELIDYLNINNVENAYIFKGLIPSEVAFILLDYLVATGIYIMEGFRALSDAKFTAIGAVTACATGRNSLIR